MSRWIRLPGAALLAALLMMTAQPSTAATAIGAPTLVSPSQGKTVKWRENITFDWTDVSGAARYYIQVDGNPNFGTSLVFSTTMTTSSAFWGTPGYYDQDDNSTTGLRYWRVLAIAPDGTLGPWSATRSFTVKK